MSFRAVACSPPSTSEAGFATPAALVLSLALALVGTAMVGRSVSLLVLAKSDLQRTRLEYAMNGAQLEAAATVVRAGLPGPFHWTSSTDLGWVDIRAEREADKLSLAKVATLAPQMLMRFGVSDPAALQARLTVAASDDVVDVSGLDSARLWRACAVRFASTFGQKDAYAYAPDAQPLAGDRLPLWRVSETWRIRVTTAAGWRDDRIVRFTGSAEQPAAIILRTISKGEGEGGRCESILQALSVG